MKGNRRLRTFAGWIATSLVLTLALPVAAGVGEGNWEVGFGIGATEFDSDVTDENGDYFGFRGGYFFSNLFQLEGLVEAAGAEQFNVDIVMTSLFVDAVFNFHPSDNIVPYVLVGVGSTNLEFDFGIGPSIDDDATSTQVAAGSRFFVGAKKKMAVRVELGSMSEDTFDERSTHTKLSVGLVWRLGPEP